MKVTFHFLFAMCWSVCISECVFMPVCTPVCERESGRAGQGKEIFTGAKYKTKQEIKTGKDEK